MAARLAPLPQRAAPRQTRPATLGLLAAAAAGALWQLVLSSDAFVGGSQALQTRSPEVACGIAHFTKKNKKKQRIFGAEILGQNRGRDCTQAYLKDVIAQSRRKLFVHRLESFGRKKPNLWNKREQKYKIVLAKTLLNQKRADEARANYVEPERILLRDLRSIEDCRNAFENFAQQPDMDHNKANKPPRDRLQYHVYEEDAKWARENFPDSKAMLWDKVKPNRVIYDPKEAWYGKDRRLDLVEVYPIVNKSNTIQNDGGRGYHRRYPHNEKKRAHIKALLEAKIAEREAMGLSNRANRAAAEKEAKEEE